MHQVAMDLSVPNFSAWLMPNGVSAYGRRHPSTDLRTYGNNGQNCYDIDVDPQFSLGSYPFGPYGLADDDGLGYTAFASHPSQRSDVPRYYSGDDNEYNASREFCHNANRFGGLSEVPEDAAVQDIWAHGYMRNNAQLSRLSSVNVTDPVPMELDPVPSDEPFLEDRPFGFSHGIAHPGPESGSSQSVFSQHSNQDVDPSPQRKMTNEHHLLSNAWHDPSKPLRSEPMRRGSKVLPNHVQFGSREGPPNHGNTWSRNMRRDGVSHRMEPNTGPQPEEWRYNYWSRPASLMWVTIRRSYLTVKYLVLTIPTDMC